MTLHVFGCLLYDKLTLRNDIFPLYLDFVRHFCFGPYVNSARISGDEQPINLRKEHYPPLSIVIFCILVEGECHMLGSFSYASPEGEILGNYPSSK